MALLYRSVVSGFLALLIAFGFTVSVYATDASTNSLPIEKMPMWDDEKNAEFDYTVSELKKYVVISSDNTLKLDENYKNENLKEEYVQYIETWISELNDMIKSGEVKVDSNLNVTYTDDSNLMTFSSSGQNGIKLYWWGFKLYMNNSLSKKVVSALAAGATAAEITELISDFIPTPPTRLAGAILKASKWLLASGAGVIAYKNKGKGVYIRFVWPMIPTGVFSQ